MFMLLVVPFANVGGGVGTTAARGIHLGTVHVNVTYENTTPASGVTVYLHRYDDLPYFGTYMVTDGLGKVLIIPTSNNLGPCYITVANATEALWTRVEAYIEPLREHHFDIVLSPGINYDNVVIGTVRNLSNGLPMDGVPVLISGYDVLGRRVYIERSSGGGGHYSFSVPYSQWGYLLETNTFQSFGTYDFSMKLNLNRSKTTYEQDIWLRNFPVRHPLNIRFTHEGTGMPFKDAYAYTHLLGVNWDHQQNYHTTPVSPSGWYNYTGGGKGEYDILFESVMYQGDGSCRQGTTIGVIMNDTPTQLQIGLPFRTTFRNVTVNVVEEGTSVPVTYTGVSTKPVLDRWSKGFIETFSFGGTGTTGTLVLPVIPDREIRLIVSPGGYYFMKEVIIPAGPLDDDPVITVHMKRDPGLNTYGWGNISLVVKDQSTGAVIPKAYIRGQHAELKYTVISGDADDSGYLNQSVIAGRYSTITVNSALGTGTLHDVIVPEGQTVSRTLYITQRREHVKSNDVEYTFRLVDMSGNPITGFPFAVLRKEGDSFYTGITSTNTDGSGEARITVPPGDYVIWDPGFDSISQTRPHWVFPKDLPFHVPLGGGVGPDVIAYSSYPFTQFTGALKVKGTGESIPGAEIVYRSGLDLRRGSRAEVWDIPPHSMTYISNDMVSDTTGRFRMWGKDSIRYICSAPGFFPEHGEVDMTGGPLNLNIYLENLLPNTLFLNGSMVDYNDAPLQGKVEVYDRDRDLYLVNTTQTWQDGTFSIGVYPGRFEVRYGNDTYMESMVLEVTSTMNDLLLVVIPECIVEGYVVDGLGAVRSGITVELMTAGFEPMVSETDATGMFRFEAVPGTCTLSVEGSESFDEYISDQFQAPPLGYVFRNITLSERSKGDITGYVYGNRGGITEIFGGSTLTLKDAANQTMATATTDMDGSYNIPNITYGSDLVLVAEPPEAFAAEVEDKRPGYLPATYGPFDVAEMTVFVDFYLELMEFPVEGHYNITGHSPTGRDVYLNEPVMVRFSDPMDTATLAGNFSVVPELKDMDIEWLEDNTTLVVGHSGLLPNTTYSVAVLGTLLSSEGYRLYGASYFRWNFTTGTEERTWWLDSKDIDVSPDRTVSIEVTGAENISVFIVVVGFGSGELVEGQAGTYSGAIEGRDLEWDRVYDYHFSDEMNGSDRAPMLSGSFRTPKEPVVWMISSAEVKLDAEGNWQVNVTANSGIDIWFVIEGIGSFKLTEVDPGTYRTSVAADRFEPGNWYDYWFSDASGGPDKAPAFAGKLRAKEVGGADDEGSYWWVCLVLGGALLLVIILISVLAIVMKGRKGAREEGWGEE